MWPDQVSNPGPLTYESGALMTVLRGPAIYIYENLNLMPFMDSLGKSKCTARGCTASCFPDKCNFGRAEAYHQLTPGTLIS